MAKERTMTKDKDLKRRVRARMDKTGESYTTARSHIVRKQSPALPDGYEALAGHSDAIISAKTGKSWPEWVETLDAIGAADMKHRDIGKWVLEETGITWWSQAVTVGYERIRGLREVGQRRDGVYEVGKSRTFPAPVAALYEAFSDPERRRLWLDVAMTVRTAAPHKSLRITWEDGTNVEVYLTDKGPSKCSVHVQHGKQPTREAADAAKAFWAERFDELAAILTS
jgi:uncharacterized protein YndB with AHSA1/START domain